MWIATSWDCRQKWWERVEDLATWSTWLCIMIHGSYWGQFWEAKKWFLSRGKRGSAVRKGLCVKLKVYLCAKNDRILTHSWVMKISNGREHLWSVIILQMSRHWVSASIVRINKLNNNQLRCVSFVARGSFREDHIKRNCSQKFTKNEALGEEGRQR